MLYARAHHKSTCAERDCQQNFFIVKKLMVDRGRLDYLVQIGAVDTRIESQNRYNRAELLPDTFIFGKWDVLCHGGKEAAQHIGNRRYRVLIANNATAYRNAASRFERSLLVSNIVASVKHFADNGLGGFVKKVAGRWYRVQDNLARQKVSHALREAIKMQKKQEAKQRSSNKTGITCQFRKKPLQESTNFSLVSSPLGHFKSKMSCSHVKLHRSNVAQEGRYTKQAFISCGDEDFIILSDVLPMIENRCDDWEMSLTESMQCFLEEKDLSWMSLHVNRLQE